MKFLGWEIRPNAKDIVISVVGTSLIFLAYGVVTNSGLAVIGDHFILFLIINTIIVVGLPVYRAANEVTAFTQKKGMLRGENEETRKKFATIGVITAAVLIFMVLVYYLISTRVAAIIVIVFLAYVLAKFSGLFGRR